MEELKIGDKIQLGNKKLEISEELPGTKGTFPKCEGCFFNGSVLDCSEFQLLDLIPSCSEVLRKDKKNIIFKEIKNV